MPQLTLAMYPVRPENKQPQYAHVGAIDAPVGFRFTAVVQQGDAVYLVGLAVANAVKVEHKVIMVALGDTPAVPIGCVIGDYLGNARVPTDGGIVNAQLFKLGEWPKTSLITGGKV